MSYKAFAAALILVPFVVFCVFTLVHVIRTLRK
jgi:hypothetical protein